MGVGAALIGASVLGAVSSAYAANEQKKAAEEQARLQQQALEQQRQAQEQAMAQQREQAARAQLQTEIASNKANAQMANAAANVTSPKKNQNSANLTGGTGIATADLPLGGSAQLGTSGISNTLGSSSGLSELFGEL